MNIHTVMVTYNRLELTRRAIKSYLATVQGPWSLTVVDNGSTDGTEDWLKWFIIDSGDAEIRLILLGQNKYPGYATNRGWELSDVAVHDVALLHRADNDFVFLEGWEEHVRLMFSANPRLGQLGLRTDDEELHNPHNVGGNCVIRKQLWDEGLRYDERPWPKIAAKVPGYTEDSFLSPAVAKMGWEWGRVTQPCIRPISSEDPEDPYYIQTWTDRGMR
jgi:glycosyltransferase involved in cell wall biosynthesis